MTPHTPIRAAVDEITPELREGVLYVVVAAITMGDPAELDGTLKKVIDQPGRTRGFHWRKEGDTARERMIDCIIATGLVAHVTICGPTGRTKLVAARARCLTTLVPALVDEGVTEMVIESQGPRDDERDKATLLDALKANGQPGTLQYRWQPKGPPFLWAADAICGSVGAYLLGQPDSRHYQHLVDAGVITEPVYIRP